MSINNTSSGKSMSADLEAQARAFQKLVSEDLPGFAVEAAEDLINDSFDKEQFQDAKSSKWKARKRDKEGGKERESRRGLLVKSGDLRRATGAERRGQDIVIFADSKYAQIHNEGLKGLAFGKHEFKMPQRQFMPVPGEDSPLNKKIEEFQNEQMDKIFK